MEWIKTQLSDVVRLKPIRHTDSRGWFVEHFHAQRFAQGLSRLGLSSDLAWAQDNESCSHRGVLRGLHFQQCPHGQGKLIRVVQGAIYDVAVDMRLNSPTVGQWVGVHLTAQDEEQLWIGEGFAHGFLALADNTRVLYKTTRAYAPEAERAVRWNDPTLAIQWPLTDVGELIVSAKDQSAPLWHDADRVKDTSM